MPRQQLNYHYSHYGFRVRSDLSLPELMAPRASDTGEIVIRRGNVLTDPVAKATKFGSFLRASREALCVSIPNIVSIIARQGEELIYEPAVGVDDESVRLYLFGSGMAAILMQRGYLVLHGNAVETSNGGVVCLGNSGAGKSTTAAGMLQRGYRIVADDVCAIDSQGYVLPGLPRIKLWQESADFLGIDTRGFNRIRPELEKFNIPLGSNYCSEPRKIHTIVALDQGSENGVKTEPVLGQKKFLTVQQNNFRPRYVKALGQDPQNFIQITKLASGVSITRLSRPKNGIEIETVLDEIELLTSNGVSDN